VNAYGFAAGDPVSYGDAFGLTAGCNPPFEMEDCPRVWLEAAMATVSATIEVLGDGIPGARNLTTAIFGDLQGKSASQRTFAGVLAVGEIATLPGGGEGEALSAEGRALLRARPVRSALKADAAHNAATFVREEAARTGTHFKLIGGDGVERTLTQIPGELNGQAGRFEYIVEKEDLTHQMFVRGGTINGVPIKP
jgi:hypothetical protein